MRVLKVVQSYFPFQDRGGPVVKVRALARGLAKRGQQVTVLTADLGIRTDLDADVKVSRCKWGWCAQEDEVEIIYLPTLAHYRALTVNPRVVAFCRASISQFDLVHLYGLYDLLGPVVSYFCRRRGIPYLIEPMGMYRPIDRSFRMKRYWHRSLGEVYWRNAAQIVATSEMEQQELVEHGVPGEKIVIRYNGIDGRESAERPQHGAFRAKWGIPVEEPLVLFLGRLIPRKGADILIEAFSEACPKSGRLVIAGPEGEPGYRATLEQRACEAGIESRVIFTGAIYDYDKSALMMDTTVFVLPSRYENFANSAAEAIAYDIPVIVTDSCGICSLVKGRAGLVIAPEEQQLVAALRNLISDRVLYAKLKAGCREVAAELGWDRLTEQMEGHYTWVLKHSHGHL